MLCVTVCPCLAPDRSLNCLGDFPFLGCRLVHQLGVLCLKSLCDPRGLNTFYCLFSQNFGCQYVTALFKGAGGLGFIGGVHASVIGLNSLTSGLQALGFSCSLRALEYLIT